MKKLFGLTVATAFLFSPAMAQERLLPGKPAGVLPAQGMRMTELYLFGLAGVVAVGLGVGLLGVGKNTVAVTATAAP